MRARRYGVILLAVVGLGLIGKGLWIPAKAALAQVLLERSWEQSLASGTPTRPWPWADHHAVAKIEAPAQGIHQIILSGDTGRSLAFAPGQHEASGQHGAATVISAHRDTHFRFLKDVSIGETLILTTPAGQKPFEITVTAIVDSRVQRLDPHGFPEGLILVTCYPFEILEAQGPLRFVVFAAPPRASSSHQWS